MLLPPWHHFTIYYSLSFSLTKALLLSLFFVFRDRITLNLQLLGFFRRLRHSKLSAMFPRVKQEDASTPYIKADPDSKDTVLADIDDEDLYEDAGDLDFTSAGQNVWLSRIPRSLWEHWSKLDDDEEIPLGTVRVEGDTNNPKRVKSLILFPSCLALANSARSVGQFAPSRAGR